MFVDRVQDNRHVQGLQKQAVAQIKMNQDLCSLRKHFGVFAYNLVEHWEATLTHNCDLFSFLISTGQDSVQPVELILTESSVILHKSSIHRKYTWREKNIEKNVKYWYTHHCKIIRSGSTHEIQQMRFMTFIYAALELMIRLFVSHTTALFCPLTSRAVLRAHEWGKVFPLNTV